MASTPAQKRRKITVKSKFKSHTNCKLHKDDELRDRVCNGAKKDGSHCTSKIKRAQAAITMASGYFPMCKIHNQQKLQIGHCEAIADCGKRCNRVVFWTLLEINAVQHMRPRSCIIGSRSTLLKPCKLTMTTSCFVCSKIPAEYLLPFGGQFFSDLLSSVEAVGQFCKN